MKTKDLVVGETYAYSERREPTTAQQAVLKGTRLYFIPSFPRGAPHQVAAPGRKPQRGGSYGETKVGLLVTIAWHDGKERDALVMPQDLHMTWADWLVHDAAASEARRADREARLRRDQELADQAALLQQALNASPYKTAMSVRSWESRQLVPNDMLLELLTKVNS